MLDIYKASAGAGKTFALTLEYFRIIFESPQEYRNILAVTFTNKATEEMKSRIINELNGLAEGRESDYGRILKQEMKFTDERLKNRAFLLRTMLLHDYGRLSVTTIDRFFQRILKMFTRELGIFPGYNVELDSNYVLLKAVDKVMQQVKDNPELKNWISELMNHNVEEGKTWSIKSRIAELGEELFKENYMLFDKEVLDKFGDKYFLKDYRCFLLSVKDKYEGELMNLALKALELISKAGLQQADFKGGKAGCVSYFYKIAEGNFDEPTATVRKGLKDAGAWVTKTSVNKGKIEGLQPQLTGLLQKIIDVFDRDYRNYLSAVHLAGNLYQLGILKDLYGEVRAYCDEKGVMLLSDTTHILNLLIANNDTSFLFEKCGNYYKHLMIDEFQDTSAMQWKNFRPLMVNSLGEGCKAMIVGDVKQSIYRWRNGDWSLLAKGVENQFRTLGVNNIVLRDNWRSAREIVSFNNEFFEKAAGALALLYSTDIGGEDYGKADVIKKAYADLQQYPRKQKTGYVDICFGPEKKEEGADQIILSGVVSLILDILKRGGVLKDIVILVRGAKEGAFVADFLIEYNKKTDRKINFISNDSLYVWSSPYVQFIIAVLKFIIEPYDLVNKATILYFYRIFVQESVQPELHSVFSNLDTENLWELIGKDLQIVNDQVLAYSLYETIEIIIDRFSLESKQEEIPYLIALQDIIHEYESNNSNSITLFLEWWEKERGKRVLSTSEEVDAVRILTIHKSKGLEFEYVILPFCCWELDSIRPLRCLWCRSKEEGFSTLDYAPLNYSSKLAGTLFKEDYLEEHLKAYIDNLNLLYVALTRAKTELYIRPYSPKINKDGSISVTDIGAFTYLVLTEMDDRFKGESYILGTKQLFQLPKEEKDLPLTLKQYPVWETHDRISVRYRYRDYSVQKEAGYSAIDEGRLLHEIFKSIKYLKDVEEAVQQAYLAGLISFSARADYCAKIYHFLGQTLASEWFTEKYEVINEREILFPGGKKIRPDRVISHNGKVQIIDYKFGRREELKYLKQVKFYCDSLRKMGFSQVEGYVWYVRNEKIIRV